MLCQAAVWALPGNRVQAIWWTQTDSVQLLLQVLVSPLEKLTFKVGASVKDIGPPEALLGSFGPYITGRLFVEGPAGLMLDHGSLLMSAGLHGRLYQKGPPATQYNTAKQSHVAAAAQLSTAARQAQGVVMLLLQACARARARPDVQGKLLHQRSRWS